MRRITCHHSAGARTGAMTYNPLIVALFATLISFVGGLTGCEGRPAEHGAQRECPSPSVFRDGECVYMPSASTPFAAITRDLTSTDQNQNPRATFTAVLCRPDQASVTTSHENLLGGHEGLVPLIDRGDMPRCESGLPPSWFTTELLALNGEGPALELEPTDDEMDLMYRLVAFMEANSSRVIYHIPGPYARTVRLSRGDDTTVTVQDTYRKSDGSQSEREFELELEPMEDDPTTEYHESRLVMVDLHFGNMTGGRFAMDAVFVPEAEAEGKAPFFYRLGGAESSILLPDMPAGLTATIGMNETEQDNQGEGVVQIGFVGVRPTKKPLAIYRLWSMEASVVVTDDVLDWLQQIWDELAAQ